MKKTIIIFGIILSILLIKSNTNAASVYQTQAEQQINNGQSQYAQQAQAQTTAQVNENTETAQAVMQNNNANANQQQLVYSKNKSDTIAQATNKKDEGLISEHTKGQLIEIRTKELKSIEDYQKQYGNAAFGVVAYIRQSKNLQYNSCDIRNCSKCNLRICARNKTHGSTRQRI